MKRFLAILVIVAAAFGAHSVAPKPAEAGISFGIGIGYGYPIYRPRYYYPRYGYRRYYRPRVYRRYVRPRRVYRRSIRRGVVRRRGFSAAHYGYCSTKYRSYRVSDNTFQPYRGPRRQCRSRF